MFWSIANAQRLFGSCIGNCANLNIFYTNIYIHCRFPNEFWRKSARISCFFSRDFSLDWLCVLNVKTSGANPRRWVWHLRPLAESCPSSISKNDLPIPILSMEEMLLNTWDVQNLVKVSIYHINWFKISSINCRIFGTAILFTIKIQPFMLSVNTPSVPSFFQWQAWQAIELRRVEWGLTLCSLRCWFSASFGLTSSCWWWCLKAQWRPAACDVCVMFGAWKAQFSAGLLGE